jgi:hypothetical protein
MCITITNTSGNQLAKRGLFWFTVLEILVYGWADTLPLGFWRSVACHGRSIWRSKTTPLLAKK